MGALKVAFLLVTLLQGSDGSFTLTQLAAFESQAACDEAWRIVISGLATGSAAAKVGCIAGDALERLTR